MNYTDDEIEMITEYRDLRSAYLEAKEGREKNPEKYQEAKRALSEYRAHWRSIREAVAPVTEDNPDAPDGTAGSKTISASSAVNTRSAGDDKKGES